MNFPSTPQIGDLYTLGNKTWQWTGVAWKIRPNPLTASDIPSLDASKVSTGVFDDARIPALTGDVTKDAGSSVTTLATVNSNVGTFGDASTALTLTVDAKGRITAVSTSPLSGATWASISDKPTTLSGYGITDAQPLDSTLTALAGLSGAGVVTATGTDAFAMRAIGVGSATDLLDRQSGDARYLGLGGGTLTGTLTLAADPTLALHAATKQYVDNAIQGLDAKASVRVATVGDIILAGIQTIDGAITTTGDRVLVRAQTNPVQNGIYVVSSGAWTRATDMNDWAEVPGSYVFVEAGSTFADTGWVCTSEPGGTLGSTAVDWVQFSGAPTLTASNGVTKIGSDLQLTGQALALHTLSSNGLIARTGAGTVTARSIVGPASGLAIANGDGVSGNPTISLTDDLAAVEGLSSTGFVRRTGANTWAASALTGTEITDALGYTPFNPVNDGDGSTLDADLLDGQHGSYYLDLANATGLLDSARLAATVVHRDVANTFTGKITAPSVNVSSSNQSAISRTMSGLELTGDALNTTTAKYGPAIKFMNADADYVTSNPRLVAYVAPYAGQNASSDITGSVGLEFGVTSDNPGASSVPSVALTLRPDRVAVFTAPPLYMANAILHAGSMGSGSGIDADLLDGQQGSFYQNAGNINTGTLGSARLSGAYTGITGLGTQTSDLLIQKNNAWMTLRSSNIGDEVAQAAGLSIGRNGYKGANSLHFTYTGEGKGYIGMGVVDPDTSIPEHWGMRLNYESNTVTFASVPNVMGADVLTTATLDVSTKATLGDAVSFASVAHTSPNALSLAANDQGLQVGPTGSNNLIAAPDGLQARNNGAAAPLYLNPLGGVVYAGGNTGDHEVLTNLSTLDAAKLSGLVPTESLSGVYDDLTLRLTQGRLVYSVSPTSSGRAATNLAQFRTAASSTTGAIVFSAPNTATDIMHQLHIRSLNHAEGVIDFVAQAYKPATTWTSLAINHHGSVRPMVRFGNDGSGRNCIVIGDVDTVWPYTHIAIVEALLSHTGVSDAYVTGWTAAVVTNLASFTYLTADLSASDTSYAAAASKWATGRTISLTGDVTGTSGSFDGSGNLSFATSLTAASVLSKIITVDGTGSNLDADLLDGQHGSFYSNAGNINAGVIGDAYLPSTMSGKTFTSAVTFAPDVWLKSGVSERIQFANSASTYFKSPIGHVFRNGSDVDVVTISGAGAISAANTVTATAFHGSGVGLTNIPWANITGTPTTYTPGAHTHAISDVTNLQSSLDAKLSHGGVLALGMSLNMAATTTDSTGYGAWSRGFSISGDPTDASASIFGAFGVDDTPSYAFVSALGGWNAYNSANTLRVYDTYAAWGTNKLWHEGNDGVGSGLDADLLDGQQGSYYTNAVNLTGTIAAARLPALTGDVTSPAGSTATTLATVNSNVGSYGTATATPTFTVNAKGLITAAGQVTITPAWGSITGKPTTLSGYGITDAQPTDAGLTSIAGLTGAGVVTATATDSFAMRAIGSASSTDILDRNAGDGRYAQLTAATNVYTGTQSITRGLYSGSTEYLHFQPSDYATGKSRLAFTHNNGTWQIGTWDGTTSGLGTLNLQVSTLTQNGSTIWTAANDGVGSGLDADLLDGQHGSYYTNAANLTGTIGAGSLPSDMGSREFSTVTVRAATPRVIFDDSSYSLGVPTGLFWIYSNGGNFEIRRNTSNDRDLSTYVTDLRVNASGWVTIPSLDVSSQIQGNGDDTATWPTYSFSGDSNTGMWRTGADSLGFSTGGTNRLTINNSSAAFESSTVTVGGNQVHHTGNFSPASKLDANTAPVHSQRDFLNGVLVTTTLDYPAASGSPFMVEIEGNSYGGGIPFHVRLQGYCYSNTVINAGGYSVGRPIEGIVAMGVAGKLCFWWPKDQYWEGFNVKVYDARPSGIALTNCVASITDVAKPAGSAEFSYANLIQRQWNTGTFDPATKFDKIGGVLNGSISTSYGADRYLTLGSSTSYNYQLIAAGDHFQIREASDAGKIRLQISYPSGNVSFQSSTVTAGGNTMWHAGNDGAGSGLDADTVDGVQLAGLVSQPLGATTMTSTSYGYQLSRGPLAGSNYGGWARAFSIAGGAPDTVSTAVFGASGSADVVSYAYLGVGDSGAVYNSANALRLYPTYPAWGTNTIWHAGNDGASSGLDADLLDGQHGSYYTNAANLTGTVPSARLSGAYGAITSVGTQNADFEIYKSNAWLTLRSLTTGGTGVEQGAGISIGESGKKGGAALHLTYTGDGFGYIGMGVVSETTGLPANPAITLFYNDSVVRFATTPTVSGSSVWHAGNDGAGSGLDADVLDGMQPYAQTVASTIMSRDSTGQVSAQGLDCNIQLGNNVSGAPWYGIGRASISGLGSSAGSEVQVAGYYGLRLRSSSGILDLFENGRLIAYPASGKDFCVEGHITAKKGIIDGSRDDLAIRPTRIMFPDGGVSIGNPSTTTGAIKIKLPTAVFNSNTMLTFKVRIFDYSNGGSKEFLIAGYNYNSTWINMSAVLLGDNSGGYSVRFGHDGASNCVWIGETTTTWSYPQVYITDVTCGYTGYSNSFATGWAVSFVTAFDTVTQTRSAAQTWNSTNDGSGSGLDADLLDGLQGASYVKVFSQLGWGHAVADDAATAKQMRWSNYGAGHVIFDASSTLSPSNTTVDRTNSTIAWSAAYPTLMGWNGTNTYGVRVDTSRYADYAQYHASGNTPWHPGNDGSGSGLDADLLDGVHASSFLRSDTTNTSVRINAGNGDGIRFWDSADYSIWMSAATNATYGGRVAGETTSDYNMYFRMTGSGRGFVFKNGTTNVAGIDGSGNFRCTSDIVAYASDRRLKTNITAIQSPLEKLSRIGGYTFDWDRELTTELGFKPYQYEDEHGFIAQEIEEVVPDAVRPAPFSDEYLTVKYERIMPLAVAGINELAEKNAKLESRVQSLEEELASIKAMLETLMKKD